MVGDRSNGLVAELSKMYVRERLYYEVIDLCERLLGKRVAEISDYGLAETLTVLAEAYWKSLEPERAIEVLERGEHFEGDRPYVKRLKERLEEYRWNARQPPPSRIHPRPIGSADDTDG